MVLDTSSIEGKMANSLVCEPVKVCYQYKNIRQETKCIFLIFIGKNIDKRVKKILDKIKDDSLIDALVHLKNNENELLIEYYKDTWYTLFYPKTHIRALQHKCSGSSRLSMLEGCRLDQKWLNRNFVTLPLVEKPTVNFQSFISSDIDNMSDDYNMMGGNGDDTNDTDDYNMM